MAVAGSLTYDTKIDKNGFEKGLNSLKKTTGSIGGQIKSIVAALGIDKLISATFSLLNNSLDGAISRLDTLNNYPKVMSNLGIASEDAQKSIDKMSDKLAGLPTTLDEGALAVQRFTSKNSNIAKSTDYFLALNNALLAGGASADIQSTALEQLSQAYAKGKPDMMEWRSLMTAMPAQLKQVATAMGYVSTDKLGEDLRNGKVSMDKFMDTIVKLNTEGVAGFQSFEEQARNSTGGIATSIKVAKTQVVKGVTDIIKALDESLKNSGFGGISEIIANLGKKAKEVLDKIAELIKAIDWNIILNTIKKLIPLIGTLITGFLAMQAIESVNKFIQETAEGVNKLGKAIQLIMAHPIIAVITAIIALLVILYQKNEAFRNAVNEAFEQIKNALMSVWNTIKPALEELWEALKELLIALKPVGEFLVAVLIVAIKVLAEVLKALIPIIASIITVVIRITTTIINIVTNTVNAIVTFFTETIPNAFNNLVNKIQEFVNGVISFFSNLPYNIGLLIGEMIAHIYLFGVNALNWVTTELPRIINGIINWFRELPGRTWTWLLNTINNVINWGREMSNRGRQGAQDLFNNIVNTIKSLPSQMLNIGRNIVQGLWNGIVNAKNWVIGKVKEFARGILDGMKSALGIHSPSALFRDEVGEMIPARSRRWSYSKYR